MVFDCHSSQRTRVPSLEGNRRNPFHNVVSCSSHHSHHRFLRARRASTPLRLLSKGTMTSRCGVACTLIAAAVSTFAITAIISAATAEPDSSTGELGKDPNPVYQAHTGLCKSKNRAHSFAGHSHSTQIVTSTRRLRPRRLRTDCADYTIDEQSVCQTICDWNASCAAYEWGAGCYVSSVWGFQVVVPAPTRSARAPRATAPAPGRASGTVRKGAGVD